MDIKAAKALTASKGLELWFDRYTQLWTVTNPNDPMQAAEHLSPGSLRDLDAQRFEDVYLADMVKAYAAKAVVMVDLRVENHGSLMLVRPLTDAGKEWLKETAPDDAQFMGAAMAVEPRYVGGVIYAAIEAGLEVK